MVSNEKFEIKGLSDVEKALNELPAKLSANIIRNFLRKAGKKYISDGLKARLNYSAKTESTIGVVNDNRDKLRIQAGVTSDGYYLRWADRGTKLRTTKKGANRGQINGKNEVGPFIEEQIDDVVKYTEDELANEINKNIERRLKKLKKVK